MHSFLTFMAAIVTYGLTFAGLRIYADMLIMRAAEKQKRARLRRWRSTVPDVEITPDWPRTAYMGCQTREEAVITYVRHAEDGAFSIRAMMVACRTKHAWRDAPHAHN